MISWHWRLGWRGGQVQPREGPGDCLTGFSFQDSVSQIWIMYVLLFKGKIKIPIIPVILHSLSHPVSTLLCLVSSRFPWPLASGWLGQSVGWSEGGGKSDEYLFPCPLPALVLCSGNGPVSLGYSCHQAAPLPAALQETSLCFWNLLLLVLGFLTSFCWCPESCSLNYFQVNPSTCASSFLGGTPIDIPINH